MLYVATNAQGVIKDPVLEQIFELGVAEVVVFLHHSHFALVSVA